MRFMWIWQAPDWPQFQVDAQALQPALAAARLAQGRMLGIVGGLRLVDLRELQLAEWADEAVATAQIEGEALQINSISRPGGWGEERDGVRAEMVGNEPLPPEAARGAAPKRRTA